MKTKNPVTQMRWYRPIGSACWSHCEQTAPCAARIKSWQDVHGRRMVRKLDLPLDELEQTR